MATIETLLVKIEADTARLRRELERGDAAVAASARKIEASTREQGARLDHGCGGSRVQGDGRTWGLPPEQREAAIDLWGREAEAAGLSPELQDAVLKQPRATMDRLAGDAS